MEEWRVLTDYPGYSVSSFGKVRNDKTGRLLKGSNDGDGYLMVHLSRKNRNKRIHKLVGGAFLENPENKPTIDHINGVRTDNNVSNLRWATSQEQNRNKIKMGGCSSKYKGVSWEKKEQRWRSRIRLDGRLIQLGNYETEEEAGLAFNKFIIEKNLQDFYILNNI